MVSTRLDDLNCPVAAKIRDELEGPLNMSAIRDSMRRSVNSTGSTLAEDAGDPLLLAMRAASGEKEAKRQLRGALNVGSLAP